MRILAFAYACEPDKGSEPGAGWAWARMLARLGEVWVVTRANNRQAIELRLPDLPERNRLRFVYVDLPPWARFWKRGQWSLNLYYLLWQAAALRTARRLSADVRFDLTWHLTFANAWLGSPASFMGLPFVYGPVGGGIGPCWRFLPALGTRGSAYEISWAVVRALGRYCNPLARLAWRRARLILAQNPETVEWLPRRHRSKAEVFPNAVLEELPPPRPGRGDGSPTALFAGRLLAWKGGSLAVRTVSLLPRWRLLVCGAGPDEARLRRLARRLGATERVEFLGWRSREQLLEVMRREADVLLFPSLHEEGGWAVVEGLGCGLPVVCLDRGNPRLLAGSAALVVSADGGSEAVVSSLAATLAGNGFPHHEIARRRAEGFLLEARAERLRSLLKDRYPPGSRSVTIGSR